MSNDDIIVLWQPTLRVCCISILVFLNLLGIASIAGFIDVAFAAPTVRNSNLRVQTVATGLSSPTSMAFIGPNDILVLEKNTGMVKRVKDGRVLSPPLLNFHVATDSERGLLGIEVIKTSSIHHYVFIYWTKALVRDGGTPVGNLLSRFIFTNNPDLGSAQGSMTSPKTLLNLPYTPGPNHDGGKVAISLGGYVYTGLGDLNRMGKAQNFENGANADGTGGILRVTRDGNIVPPTVLGNTHPLNKYVAYGIRNSFGMDFDPVTGRLWNTENGPSSNDEINLVGKPGFNSGWRDIMGMAPAGFNFNNLESFGGKGTYSNPEFVWRQVVAPTAVEFLNSLSLGSQYRNDMFVGDFNKGRIYNFNLNSDRNALVLTGVLSDKVANTDSETQPVIFGEGFGGISDLKVGIGDGYLYVLSISNGAIYRVLPDAASTAAFIADPVEEQRAGEEDSNQPPNPIEEELSIDSANDDNDEPNTLNHNALCKKLDERIKKIEDQEDRGGLNEEQVKELRQRIEAIQNNQECQQD